jgi:myosin protein heavy chain
MEDKLRQLHAKGFELDTMLQVEVSTRRAGDEAVRQLTADVGNISAEARELRSAAHRAESERARMEAEARDSGEQLREMAEKVFQLLERLKLAELGKTRAMEESGTGVHCV